MCVCVLSVMCVYWFEMCARIQRDPWEWGVNSCSPTPNQLLGISKHYTQTYMHTHMHGHIQTALCSWICCHGYQIQAAKREQFSSLNCKYWIMTERKKTAKQGKRSCLNDLNIQNILSSLFMATGNLVHHSCSSSSTQKDQCVFFGLCHLSESLLQTESCPHSFISACFFVCEIFIPSSGTLK